MLPSLSLPRCCIWPPRTAASRRGHPDAALSSRFVIRVRPADAANAALPGSTCTLCTMRHDHRIRPRLLCTPAHHSHIGYTMLDIEDGDAFPHILIENECLHVTRRLIWSFCTMRRASRPGVVLCVRWLLRPPPVVLGRSSPDGPRAHRLDQCCVDINRNAHSCAGRHSASCPRQAQEQAAFFRRFSGRRPNAHIARIARVPRAPLPNCRAHATHVPMRNGIAVLCSAGCCGLGLLWSRGAGAAGSRGCGGKKFMVPLLLFLGAAPRRGRCGTRTPASAASLRGPTDLAAGAAAGAADDGRGADDDGCPPLMGRQMQMSP